MTSPASTRSLRIAILGAGMAGMLAAIRLRQEGKHDVVVYEKADRVGGTWRENTYPGLACDVPAHAYTYSFAPNPEWSSYLSPGPEIQRYFESVAEQYQLDQVIQYGQEVTRCEWQDGRWQIETAAGIHDRADVVVAATGVLHHPRMPEIDGLDTFQGPCFHSAQWDHSVPLDGKRIAVIGCGSTGVQIVSALAGRASKLVHIQRSPQWIMPTPNMPYSEEQKAAFRADPALIDEIRYNKDYIAAVRRFTDAVADMNSPEIREIEAIVKQHLEDSVRDPILREQLRPTYRAACKRLIYSSDYYEKVQRPDVEIAIGAIDRVVSNGVHMADGSFHEVDILVLATGYHADRFVRPMKVSGRDGLKLDELWSRAPTAYLGVSIAGFPNFFMLNGPTGPVGNFSLIDIAERQWGYIEHLLADLTSGKANSIELKKETLQDYDARRIEAARNTIFGSGCSSWYIDATGVPASWPWSYDVFAERTAKPVVSEYVYHV
ncbi:MAG: NAD(P)/FAD-dependent oxidoreductase [Thauera sp.]|jgi:cation diffusion facilitator CzcD-associated flavoprotein CzcO|nr:NAD(P)/FAD-dependent oxidoreductase [Thauera sp.]